jgi:UDP-glucose 4-epimerase
MRFLVTGGAGFIGSHLTDALLSRGDKVVVVDDFSSGSKENLDHQKLNGNLEIISASILDKEQLLKAFSGVDGCFHMAAAVGVEKILKDPIGSIKTNIHGSENVLDIATDLGIPLLLASTSEIYGKNSSGLLSEESDRIIGSPLLSRWSYSDAKAIDESYSRALYEQRGLQVKIIRYFNTVGPRQSAAYGMVIPKFFSAAIQGKPLQVYGDGTQQRVFCDVGDAVRGTLALWDSQNGFGEVFNLGGFEETSINDLAKKILAVTSSNSPIESVSYEKLRSSGFEDMLRRLPDTSKLRGKTGWIPLMGLDEILSSFYNHLIQA